MQTGGGGVNNVPPKERDCAIRPGHGDGLKTKVSVVESAGSATSSAATSPAR